MDYKPDIFYSIEYLSYDKIMDLVKEAMDHSYYMIVDKIEFPGGQRKVQLNVDPYNWVKQYPKHNSIFRFVHRMESIGDGMPYLQIVIIENADFLWINLKEDQIEHFLQKYKLKQL